MENTTITLQQQSNKIYNDEYMELSDAIKQIKEQTGEELDEEDIGLITLTNGKADKKFVDIYCKINNINNPIIPRPSGQKNIRDTKVYL